MEMKTAAKMGIWKQQQQIGIGNKVGGTNMTSVKNLNKFIRVWWVV